MKTKTDVSKSKTKPLTKTKIKNSIAKSVTEPKIIKTKLVSKPKVNKNSKTITRYKKIMMPKPKIIDLNKVILQNKNISKSEINIAKKFNTTAIIGCQWGDEGKGKITDYYSQTSDIVVRWSGGDNAGHTIVFNNELYKLSIIPSGIFNKNTYCVIASGCVINLEKLVSEMENLKTAGFNCDKLRISNRAHVILPYHIALDQCEERVKSDKAIGTTLKGIGPCYADKISRVGIRIGDLLDRDSLLEKLNDNLVIKNKILHNVYGYEKEFNAEIICNQLLQLLSHFQDLIIDSSQFLNEQLVRNKSILFEGAQGTLLDLDHGTYPFVTSSNPSANSIAIGTGISLKSINEIIGVTKAYSTRVGAGVLPSEFTGKVAEYIRETGKEYGTVSRRARRIGWFDAVIAAYSSKINGFTSLAITLLDVLTNIETLKICTHYTLKGKIINYIPSQIADFNKCEPQFIEMPGWTEDISKVTSFEQLPINAQNYLNKISQLTGVPIKIFSVGPDRKQTIFIKE